MENLYNIADIRGYEIIEKINKDIRGLKGMRTAAYG